MPIFTEFEPVAAVPEPTLHALESLPGFPPELIAAWREQGTGFIGADGYVRLIDPAAYLSYLPEWFDDTDGAIPFLATGMGDLFVWQAGVIRHVLYRVGDIRNVVIGIDELFSSLDDERYLDGPLQRGQYPQGVARLGRPDLTEAFFYAPFLPLGGPERPENLQRGDLAVSISLFTQLMGRTSLIPRSPAAPAAPSAGDAAPAEPEDVWDAVRRTLRAAEVADGAVILPGDQAPPFEGALTIGRADDGAWTLSTVDYGQARVLRRTGTDREIAEALLTYLRMPLPAPREMDAAEQERLLAWAAPHLIDIAGRAQNGLLIDVPAGLLFDRIGALDGFHLYPQGTSFEARSLPPHVLQQPLRRFVTTAVIRMSVVLTPPWFGRPGGGLRFTIEAPSIGVRDLVASGALQRLV